MEGFYDPVHVEWLHDRWSFLLNGRAVPARRPRHTGFRWLDFEHGVIFSASSPVPTNGWRTTVSFNLDGGRPANLTWVVPSTRSTRLSPPSPAGAAARAGDGPRIAARSRRVPAYARRRASTPKPGRPSTSAATW
jgi:hypothetical protein